mgnify:CR=1 FL=1
MGNFNSISSKTKIGENFKIGKFCVIEEGVEIGDNVVIGHHCIINRGVKIGSNTTIMSYVELREDTIIGNECYLDSKVSSSGSCKIGDRVILRYGAILARGVDIGDDSYLSPRVMTNNLDNEKNPIGGAKIGKGCFIGTHSVIHYGITIEDNVTIGSMAFVNKNCLTDETYIGIPAKIYKK